jgi:hypothetical protein
MINWCQFACFWTIFPAHIHVRSVPFKGLGETLGSILPKRYKELVFQPRVNEKFKFCEFGVRATPPKAIDIINYHAQLTSDQTPFVKIISKPHDDSTSDHFLHISFPTLELQLSGHFSLAKHKFRRPSIKLGCVAKHI